MALSYVPVPRTYGPDSTQDLKFADGGVTLQYHTHNAVNASRRAFRPQPSAWG